jgi:hypothetical protein
VRSGRPSLALRGRVRACLEHEHLDPHQRQVRWSHLQRDFRCDTKGLAEQTGDRRSTRPGGRIRSAAGRTKRKIADELVAVRAAAAGLGVEQHEVGGGQQPVVGLGAEKASWNSMSSW